VADRPPGQCASPEQAPLSLLQDRDGGGAAHRRHRSGGLRVHPDGQKGVQVHYFTGKHEKPVPEQDPVTGNPVLAVYLQADVYAMNRRTEGGWRYFHRAIKTSLAATNTVEPLSLDFHGRKVPASRVTITPYVGDAKRLPLKAYAHTTYAFTFADAVPGQLYEIRSLVPQPDGAPSSRRS
jgi:hypothetical protein